MSDDADFDALIRTLIPAYLADRKQDCHSLETAIAAEDADVLVDLGHRLVGSGASYGFPRISELGAEIEAAGKARDFETAARAVEALAAAVSDAH